MSASGGELVVERVTAGIGRREVLHDVSLRAEPGSIWLVAGPNGSGISTLLAALAGSIPIEGGSVALGGTPLGDLPAGTVTAVPPGRRLFPSLSVHDNMAVAARTWGMGRATTDTRIAELWARLPMLRDAADRPARTLSGGQQQLLAIARALLARPRVLVLDEPSMGLAPVAWDEVADACRDEAEAGTIVILAEQRLRLAARLADRCLVVNRGRVAFEGTGEQALQTLVEREYFGLEDR